MGGVLFHAGAATWLGNDHDLYAAPCFAYIDDSSDPRNAYPPPGHRLWSLEKGWLLSLGKRGPEHRQTASRFGFGRFILQNIPMFREHAVGHSETSAAIQLLGLPVPENRPWTIT
jgi:hypothetical protein